ncbi:neutral and basic amino acid transport protein rBAT isoform X2 [Bradysia coprophila]|uniref:neutral and basic amino acid transport protein rBAT isoform X2 n=2 Tax=Bradysia coprophila TaxID=38358 RepID=UPI00187D9E18|nr:neutral and basic amino acid transport protein rBAT isoform X2 [Bradysia coprophila]
MDEKRNSMKLDIEAVRLSDSENQQSKEFYKPIPEYPVVENAVKNSNMVREKGDTIEDGADDPMLESEEKAQLAKKEEVKFTSASDRKNGDAKIDIGEIDKGFTGMTKEELMKFANDPFWVRLRWIFFILFWALWIGMLVGAIMIIIGAPKCAAPTPLSWYKQGPLALLSPIVEQQPSEFKSIGAKGVIYELNADETYLVDTAEVKDKIKKVVDQFREQDINVIVDITPNFVGKDDALLKNALENELYRSAFIWYDGAKEPSNWLSKSGQPAWHEIEPKKYILSQFGENRFDLQLNDKFAKEKFMNVLTELLNIGVKGFRFANAKHFIVSKEFKNETPLNDGSAIHTEYAFWTHSGTTYQPGLGDLLNEFSEFVKNKTNNEAFISVTENIVQPESFYVRDSTKLGIELPIYGLLPHTLAVNAPNATKRLHTELTQITNQLGNTSWPQWIYDNEALNKGAIGLSEYHAFITLLPGVPVATLDAFQSQNLTSYWSTLQEMRTTPSYMHGSFEAYANNDIIAYTRLKSGNPGFFVAYNPTEALVTGNFTSISSMPEQLTVHLLSKNYNVTGVVERSKIQTSDVQISAKSVIILTYVPQKPE